VAKRVALGVAVVVVALGLWLRFSGVEITAEGIAQSVRSAGASAWGVAIYVGLYLVLTSVAVPGLLFHVAGGVLWGFWPGVAINVVTANVASNLQFWAGRLFGAGPLESFVEKRGIRRHLDKTRTEGLWVIFAVRQLPLPSVAVNVAAGSSAMPWWHFVVGSGLGGLVPQVIWTWFAGAVFHDPTAVPAKILLQAVGAGALALLFAVGTRVVAGRLRANAPKQ
jgi:uncharacterized membrane protein YdjX (TVP38/TMEM64 family)